MLLEDVLMIFFNQCQVQFVSVWGGGMEPRGGGAHPYAIIMSRQIDPVQPAFVCYGRALFVTSFISIAAGSNIIAARNMKHQTEGRVKSCEPVPCHVLLWSDGVFSCLHREGSFCSCDKPV